VTIDVRMLGKIFGVSVVFASVILSMFVRPTDSLASLPCPANLHLQRVGPLCVPAGAKVVVNDDIGLVAVTYWPTRDDLIEGPAPGIWIIHFFVSEGNWEIIELAAMNHSSETRETTLMWHDTKEWHALGNAVMARQYEWVFAEQQAFVWPGCEVGILYRDLWWANNDLLFVNFTLKRIE